MGEYTGVDRTYITRVEHGKLNVGLEIVLRLAQALALTPGALLDGIDPDEPRARATIHPR